MCSGHNARKLIGSHNFNCESYKVGKSDCYMVPAKVLDSLLQWQIPHNDDFSSDCRSYTPSSDHSLNLPDASSTPAAHELPIITALGDSAPQQTHSHPGHIEAPPDSGDKLSTPLAVHLPAQLLWWLYLWLYLGSTSRGYTSLLTCSHSPVSILSRVGG